jgi:aminopeptidase N
MTTTRGMIPLLALALALFVSFASAQRTARFYHEPELDPPERLVDMQHMRVELSFAPDSGIVRGTVTHTFVPMRERVDSLFLNGPGIRVLSARLNGREIPFRSAPAGPTFHFPVPLRWDERDSLTIAYEAAPRRGIYFVGWNDPTGRSRKQIWTQGQGIDNRHWIPCHDEQNDKLTTEIVITFDSAYSVLSNGALIGRRDNGDGTRTWHYRMSHPHSTYLVMLGIGTYAVDQRRTSAGVPVNLWYYPDQPERLEPTYRYSTEMVDFMARHIGVPYPWESYAQIPVQDFLYGGMENTTATVFGDFFLVDRRAYLDRNYLYVNAHELAHQWFGDFVTGRNGRSAWLQESFATFYPKLFFRERFGEDFYQWTLRTEQNAALAAGERDRFPVLHSRAGSSRVYQKGSTVLDMMTEVWGEEAYRRVIAHYLRRHAYGNVETNDLVQAFQDVLGVSPGWFFEQWIYRGGEPHYQVSVEEVAPVRGSGRETRVTVRQIHETDDLVGLFRMPIVLQVHYADGTWDALRATVAEKSQAFRLPNPALKKVAFVLFDPGSRILKRVTFEKSFEELRAQALKAPLMIDRYDALVALRATPLARKRELLREIYQRETFYAPRAEAIAQVGADTARSGQALVERALKDPSSEVRLAALNATTGFSESRRVPFEALLKDSSYAVVAAALARLAEAFPKKTEEYLAWTEGDRGVGNEVRTLRFELGARRGSAAMVDSLVDYASPASEFRTRLNALQSLKRLNILDERVARYLLAAMTHWNGRLRGPATDIGAYYLQQPAHRKVLQGAYSAGSWTAGEREILEAFFR